MRLIDADALIEDLKKWKGLDKTIEAVLETINKQPTAYDLEAVVAELEENALEHDIYGRKYSADRNVNSALNEFDKRNAYYKAIEIVRKGGVE